MTFSKLELQCTMLNGTNSRKKRDPKQLNSYVYAAPSAAERMMEGDSQPQKEYRARAAKIVAEFDRVFGGSSE
jgi:hypothetical protein